MKRDQAYKKNRDWAITYLPERNPTGYIKPTDDQLIEGRIRRKTEDIQEGLRLEREAIKEVWDE